jgi:SAM-dependent methyltransferase
MTSVVGTNYDEMPYPELAFPLSHPDHLAGLARLHGLQPAPVTACRVLELGCASGSNIIPMAYQLPGSRFVGIDLSYRQIANGRRWIDALGINNLELAFADLRELDASLGTFDYIIAHGVYSWVPADVRDALLALCRRHLAPQGVAYVSYNTYPGWRPLQALREGLIPLTSHSASPVERAALARTALSGLAGAGTALNPPYDTVMQGYSRFELQLIEQLGPSGDAYLNHELLEPVNSPCYFSDFVAHAGHHGLQYLTEADYAATYLNNLQPMLRPLFAPLADDLIAREQLIDTVRGRTFRMSLLCHAGVPLDRGLRPEKIRPFFVAADLRPLDSAVDPRSAASMRFSGPEGLRFSTAHPLSKAALLELGERWPQAAPFATLVDTAAQRLGLPTPPMHADVGKLASTLLTLFTLPSSPLRLQTTPDSFSATIGTYPQASAVARFQAQQGMPVTNLGHRQVVLDPLSNALLPYLDGSRSVSDLEPLIAAHATALQIAPEPAPTLLTHLARHALLTAHEAC